MLKITIAGETFSYDETHQPLSEGIEIEEGLGMSYGAYQEAMTRSSAKAMAGFVWSVLKRNGRDDVALADVLTGKYPVNMAEVTVEAEGGENPTGDPPSSPATDGSTSGSSPKSSDTPRRKSGSSPSPSSTT